MRIWCCSTKTVLGVISELSPSTGWWIKTLVCIGLAPNLSFWVQEHFLVLKMTWIPQTLLAAFGHIPSYRVALSSLSICCLPFLIVPCFVLFVCGLLQTCFFFFKITSTHSRLRQWAQPFFKALTSPPLRFDLPSWAQATQNTKTNWP